MDAKTVMRLMREIMEHRVFVQMHMPTKREAEIYKLCKKNGEVRSSDVAKKYGCSVQSASQTLKRIHGKGYFGRREIVDDSGGKVFIYGCQI